jgi:hypothetical protein
MNPTLSYVPDKPDKVHWLASKAQEMGHQEGQMSPKVQLSMTFTYQWRMLQWLVVKW